MDPIATHFAELDENNVVLSVIVIDANDLIDEETGERLESLGDALCKKLTGSKNKWIETCYHGTIRKNYAGVGYTYNEELDAFIPPKPYESWVLNKELAWWESPVGPAPQRTQEEKDARYLYIWNEDLKEWILTPPPKGHFDNCP